MNRNVDWIGNWDGTYKYPDTHMGGNWMTTNPIAEQHAMDEKDGYSHSNGLLKDTCKHIRFVRTQYFSSYHLSGILIDSFVYKAIGYYHWSRDDEETDFENGKGYEEMLLDFFLYKPFIKSMLYAPGSGMKVSCDDWDVLGKVLEKLV